MSEETFGRRVQRERTARGWTQEQLADISGVKRRTIQDIEGDLREKPQRATVLKLRQALDIEGDPVAEHASWPADVTAITDIVGAYMMTLSPDERIRWVSDFARGTVGNV